MKYLLCFRKQESRFHYVTAVWLQQWSITCYISTDLLHIAWVVWSVLTMLWNGESRDCLTWLVLCCRNGHHLLHVQLGAKQADVRAPGRWRVGPGAGLWQAGHRRSPQRDVHSVQEDVSAKYVVDIHTGRSVSLVSPSVSPLFVSASQRLEPLMLLLLSRPYNPILLQSCLVCPAWLRCLWVSSVCFVCGLSIDAHTWEKL